MTGILILIIHEICTIQNSLYVEPESENNLVSHKMNYGNLEWKHGWKKYKGLIPFYNKLFGCIKYINIVYQLFIYSPAS